MFYLIANFKNHFELYDLVIETKLKENKQLDDETERVLRRADNLEKAAMKTLSI